MRMLLLRARLGLAWWWRSLKFRYAHRPLCERFEHELLRVGGCHVCRSCSALYAGLAAGLLLVLLARPGAPSAGVAFLLLAPLCAVVSYPARHARLSRRARDLARAMTGLLLASPVALCAAGAWSAGLGAALLLGALYIGYAWQRAQQVIERCSGCPELGARGVCSGFRPQAEAWRAHEERAVPLLARQLPRS